MYPTEEKCALWLFPYRNIDLTKLLIKRKRKNDKNFDPDNPETPTSQDQGSKFTHLNFTLGEGGVKVNTFHPTPPHLNFFKKHFHLTSPKGETWVKIFHPTPLHLKFSEIYFHLTSPKGEIWVKIFHPTPPHLKFLNNSPKFTQR